MLHPQGIKGGERRGGKRGRGPENKTPFVAAAALNGNGHPISMDMNVAKGFQPAEIARWAKRHLAPGTLAYSDGLACFSAVLSAACHHCTIITGGGPQSVTREEFAWANTMVGNVKRAINGTCHAIRPNHLPRHLAEFCHRFNRRFQLDGMLPRLAYVAVRTPPCRVGFLNLLRLMGNQVFECKDIELFSLKKDWNDYGYSTVLEAYITEPRKPLPSEVFTSHSHESKDYLWKIFLPGQAMEIECLRFNWRVEEMTAEEIDTHNA